LFRSQVWRDARAWKSWTNLSRLRPQICEFLAQELDYRRTRGVPAARPDMLDSLVASRDEAGEPLTDVEIQDQVFTLFITAGDALAVALTWAFVWVSKLPEVQARLRAEVLALGDSPNPVKMSQLPYLERVCQEVLRLHTVLPTVSGRRLLVPMELGGYPLPVGVLVAPCEYLVHRREDLYPEPLAFQPDRFLDRPYGPHEYFPFGGSNRTCMGGSLVPLEIKLALATTLSRCRVSLIDQEPADREPAGVVRYGTLLAPAGNLHVEIQDLSSAFVPAQPPISEPRGSHA
jgi:cytochrome P450